MHLRRQAGAVPEAAREPCDTFAARMRSVDATTGAFYLEMISRFESRLVACARARRCRVASTRGARASERARFPLASVRSAFPGSHESDPSQHASRECKVLLLLAQALGGEQRLHTATTTWRIGDHAASGTRTRHMHSCG